MVVTTVLGMKRLSIKGASSKLIVGRYFLISAAIAVFIVVIASLIQHVTVSSQPINNVTVAEVVNFFFQFVPANIISPFIEANTPQLIFMALILGVMLNILRGQVPNLIRIINPIPSSSKVESVFKTLAAACFVDCFNCFRAVLFCSEIIPDKTCTNKGSSFQNETAVPDSTSERLYQRFLRRDGILLHKAAGY